MDGTNLLVLLFSRLMESGAVKTKVTETRPARRPLYWRALSSGAVLTLVVTAVLVWELYPRQSAFPAEEVLAKEQTALPSSAGPVSTALVDTVSETDLQTQVPVTLSDGSANHVNADRDTIKESGLFPPVGEQEPILVAGDTRGRGALEARKRKMQDKAGGISETILKRQTVARVEPPSIEAAVSSALKAAQEAGRKLIDPLFHKGKKLRVPEDFKTIQSAIDHAKSGDVVIVREGRYFDSIVMKDGVKLVSDSSHGGDKPVSVEGAQLRLPARTIRTIIDGSKTKGSSYWIIDFEEGVGRNTIVDGFTIENLPVQDQHVFAIAQAINVRGTSPVIMNSYIRKNASIGIGNHVLFKDVKHGHSEPTGHPQWTDIEKEAEAVIYGNVICENLGQGIRCNPFSSPQILGNEIFQNVFPYSTELGQTPSPGIGTEYGAAPTLIGNVVHDQPGGGILCDVGKSQYLDRSERPRLPSIVKNVVFHNGEHGPSILCGGGTTETPVQCLGNLIYDTGWVGIDLSKDGVCIVEDNVVSGAAGPGIRVNGATVVKLNRNKVTGANAPGFIIKNGGNVLEMVANVSDQNKGPRFVLSDGTIAEPDL